MNLPPLSARARPSGDFGRRDRTRRVRLDEVKERQSVRLPQQLPALCLEPRLHVFLRHKPLARPRQRECQSDPGKGSGDVSALLHSLHMASSSLQRSRAPVALATASSGHAPSSFSAPSLLHPSMVQLMRSRSPRLCCSSGRVSSSGLGDGVAVFDVRVRTSSLCVRRGRAGLATAAWSSR